MKTALNQLKEKVEFIKLYYENELTLNYEPHVKQILEGKLSVTDNILKEIEQLLPTEREQIINDFDSGYNDATDVLTKKFENAEQYFNQTYNE